MQVSFLGILKLCCICDDILDARDHPVIDPVWELYERAIRREARGDTL
jgi:hypothetical protein